MQNRHVGYPVAGQPHPRGGSRAAADRPTLDLTQSESGGKPPHSKSTGPFVPQDELKTRRYRAQAKSSRVRRSELAQKLARRLAERGWTSPGQRIGVAVSGGADSVALLQLLLELVEQLGIVLSVVHFNHKLRGRASDADEKFVARLAAQHGLPFFVEREDVAAKAKRERANLEEIARKSRYAFFERLIVEGRADRIAVAHTADDQAETVLAHILRGTGIAGLGGIHPGAGCVFRPLLETRRAELRTYLRSRKQAWREDATNRDVTRTRARVRHKLIPFLEKEFQRAAVEHLCQLAELAREDDASLEALAELRVFASAKEEKGGWRVAARDLVGAPGMEAAAEEGTGLKAGHDRSDDEGPHVQNRPVGHPAAVGRSTLDLTPRESGGKPPHSKAISKRMIRVLVRRVKPRAGQLSAVHVDAVLKLAQGADSGKSVHLPGGVEVRREHDSLLFLELNEAAAKTRAERKAFAYQVDLSASKAELRVVEHSMVARFEVIDWPREGRETNSTGVVLDRDSLIEPLVLRNWRPGDSMQPLGHQKRHSVSRLLNEIGVSRWDKTGWPVLTSGGTIAWCHGLPVAAEFAVGENSRTGVVITEVPL